MLQLKAWWSRLTLRSKLLVQTMVVALLSLLCAMMLLITFDQIRQHQLLEQNMNVIARVLAQRSAAAVAFDDVRSAMDNLKTLSFQESVRVACVYKVESGAYIVLAQYQRDTEANATCPERGSLTFGLQEEGMQYFEAQLFSVAPVLLDDQRIGEIFIDVDFTEHANRLRNYIFMSAIIVIITALLAWLFASPLVRLILRPLNQLDKTAQLIAQGDNYRTRAPKSSDDEVGHVVDSFNHMLDIIEQDHASLRESEEKFRLLSEASAFGVFQMSPQGQMLYCNQTLAELTGMQRHRILVEGILPALHAEDEVVFQHMITEVLRSGEARQMEGRLKHRDGKMLWVNFRLAPITQYDGKIAGYMGALADISTIKNAQHQLEELAFFDPLTQLANRRLFRSELEKALLIAQRRKKNLAVMLIDLDLFKHINDSLGHDVGDELLVEVGHRFKKCVRATDMVARFGGDEFVVLLDDIDSEYTVSRIAANIAEELSRPIHMLNTSIKMTASIGIALAPRDGSDEQTLMKHADLALYRVKETGRNGHRFFKQEMNEKLKTYLLIEKDLRRAIDEKEFVVHYQPQIDLKTKRLTGFEALVRWHHPEKGMIPPLDFIPVAEQTGLIIDIGRYVLKEASHQFNRMVESGLITADMSVAVNLSAKQLHDEKIISDIYNVLKLPCFKPHNLELEITESLLMDGSGTSAAILRFLKEQGVLLSIDDFGTGYSSLSYLKKLPIHTVKVDRSFVKDIPNERESVEITSAVIDMTHRLNYKVVAEGIETEAQLDFLQKAGCDRGQGFFISRPLSAEQLELFCEKQRDNA